MISPPLPPLLLAAASSAALATYCRRLLARSRISAPPSLFRVRFLKACVRCAMHVELAPATFVRRPAAFRRRPRRPHHSAIDCSPFLPSYGQGRQLPPSPTSLPHFH